MREDDLIPEGETREGLTLPATPGPIPRTPPIRSGIQKGAYTIGGPEMTGVPEPSSPTPEGAPAAIVPTPPSGRYNVPENYDSSGSLPGALQQPVPKLPGKDDYAAAAERLAQEDADNDKLKLQYTAWRAANETTSAGKAREILMLAAATHQDPQYVAQNFDAISSEVSTQDLQQMLATRPNVARLLLDSTKAPLIKDDVANLGWLEWLVTGSMQYIPGEGNQYWDPVNGVPLGPSDYTEGTRSGTSAMWEGAWQQQKLTYLQDLAAHNTISPDEWNEMHQLEKKYENRDYVGQQGPGAGGWLRHQAAEAWKGTINLIPYSIMAQVVGWGGALAGEAVAPEAGPIAPAVGGYVAGVGFNYLQQVGPLFRNLQRLERMDGTPILTADEARHIAIATSVATSFVTSLAGSQLVEHGLVKQTLNKVTGDGIKQAFAKATVGLAIKNGLKEFGKHELAGGVLMGAQAAANQAAQVYALRGHGEDASYTDAAWAGADGFISGMRDVAILGTWGPGRKMLYDLGVASMAKHYYNEIHSEIDAATNSKFIKNAPAEAEKFIRDLKPGTQGYYMDIAAWDKHMKTAGLDPRAAMAHLLEDNGVGYDTAKASTASVTAPEGYIHIPAEKFLVRLAQTEHGLALADDVTKDPDVPTTNQQKEFAKVTQQNTDKRIQEEKEAYDRIYERELAKAKSAKTPDQIAKDYTTMHAHFVFGMATRDPYRRSIAEWDKAIGQVGMLNHEGQGTRVDLDSGAAVLNQNAMDRRITELAGQVDPADLKGNLRSRISEEIRIAEKGAERSVGNLAWQQSFYTDRANEHRTLLKYLNNLKPEALEKLTGQEIGSADKATFKLQQLGKNLAEHPTPDENLALPIDERELKYGYGFNFYEASDLARGYRADILNPNAELTLKGKSLRQHRKGSPERELVDLGQLFLGEEDIQSGSELHQRLLEEGRAGVLAIRAALDQLRQEGGSSAAIDRMAKEFWKARLRQKYLEGMNPEDFKIKREGRVYRAELPGDEQLLNWNEDYFKQPPWVLKRLRDAGVVDEMLRNTPGEKSVSEFTGEDLYNAAGRVAAKKWGYESTYAGLGEQGRAKLASEFLDSIGVPGHRYLDIHSVTNFGILEPGAKEHAVEGPRKPTYNYMMWNEDVIRILNYYEQRERGNIEFHLAGEHLAINDKEQQVVYHGGAKTDKLSLSKAGTGAGGAKQGHGIYLTADKETGQFFGKLAGEQGTTHEVVIPSDDKLLHTDKGLVEHPADIQQKAQKVIDKYLPKTELKDYTGDTLYSELADKVGSQKKASEILAKADIPGLRYDDKRLAKKGREPANYVIWDESKVAIKPPGPAEPLKANIHTMLGADASTRAHEQGHFFVEAMSRLVESDLSHPALQQDYQTLMDFMGYKDNDQRRTQQQERVRLMTKEALGEKMSPVEKSQLKLLTAKEEKLTAAWETYLAEGKAPSKEMEPVFRRFKQWMLDIYKSVANIAGAYKGQFGRELKIPDEVKAVFDRWLSAEKEVDRADPEAKEKPLPDALKEGMTLAEKEQHAALGVSRREKAKEQLFQELKRDENKGDREKKIDTFQRAQKQAEEEVRARPEFEALRNLAASPVRLSKAAVVREFGSPALEVLPPEVFSPKGGQSPDEAALALGFDTGGELLDAVSKARDYDGAVRERTQELVAEQQGPALKDDPQRVSEAAVEAVNNTDKAREAAIERAAFNRKSTTPKAAISLAAVEKMARDAIMAKPIEGIQPQIYAHNERIAANRAYEQAVAGNLTAARDYKDAQIFNMYLAKVARQVREELAAMKQDLIDSADNKVRAELGKAHEPNGPTVYLDAHDALLRAVGVMDPDPANTTTSILPLQQFSESKGKELDFDRDLINDILAHPRPWQKLRPDQADEVHKASNNIRANAEGMVKNIAEGKHQYVEDIWAKIKEEADVMPDVAGPPGGGGGGKGLPPDMTSGKGPQPTDPAAQKKGFFQKLAEIPAVIDGALLDPETQLKMVSETLRRYIFEDGYLKAHYLERKMAKDIAQYFDSTWSEMPEELQKVRYELLPLHNEMKVPNDAGISGPTTRQWLWGVLLTMGHDKGRELTTRTMDWNERQIGNIAKKYLSPAEWKFLQSILDLTNKTLKPAVDDKNFRKNGIKAKVGEPTPWEYLNADGSKEVLLDGWFPHRFDRRNGVARPGEAGHIYDRDYIRATTTGESGYTRIPDFKWETVPAYIAQVIHDLSFDQFGNEQGTFLQRPDVQQLLVRKIGDSKTSQILDWLDVAMNRNDKAITKGQAKLYSILNWGRGVAVYSAVGFSLPVAISNFSDLGVAWVSGEAGNMITAIPSFIDTAMRYKTMRDKYLPVAEILQDRKLNWKREMRDRIGEVGKQGDRGYVGKAMERVRLMAFGAIEAMDNFTSTMIWVARFRSEMRKMGPEASEAEAIRLANQGVRFGGGPSHEPAMMSAALRDRGVIGSLLIFGGYFNKLYNIERRMIHETRLQWLEAESPTEHLGAAKHTAITAGRYLGVLAFSSLFGELLSGRGKDADEDWNTWMLRKMIAAPLAPLPWMEPIGQKIADKLITGKTHAVSVRQAPFLGVIDNLMSTMSKSFQDSRETQDKVYDWAEQIASGMRLPARQMRRTLGFWTDVATNRSRAQGFGDYLSGSIYGEREHSEQPANPVTMFTRP